MLGNTALSGTARSPARLRRTRSITSWAPSGVCIHARWRSGSMNQTAASGDHNVGYAIAIRANLDANLYAGPKTALIEQDKCISTALSIGMTNLAHVSLHQTAFKIFALRVHRMV